MKQLLSLILFCTLSLSISRAQTPVQPKLVVGIVVDQMRADYLYRYADKYSENGFKRLMREGYTFRNTQYNYIPTVTAAGHASIYTGATPSVHGIIGNSWFDRDANQMVENVQDTVQKLVGSFGNNIPAYSPKRMLSTTLGDQLRQHSNFKSKVIGISHKNRGAILPAGHSANAAYWHDFQNSPGYFVSSTYYMTQLPDWVSKFNKSGRASQYLDSVWTPLLPLKAYTESLPDDNPYEQVLQGKIAPVFPYDFKQLRETYGLLGLEYQMLWLSPWGNRLLTDFAKQAIQHERLGAGEQTDMLTISYSVPDVVGHSFGPQSVEIEDIYLRLDLEIADLLRFLDEQVGKGQYTLFLTADHGVVPVVSYLKDHKLPSGVIPVTAFRERLNAHLSTLWGAENWIQSFDGPEIYLNRTTLVRRQLNLKMVQDEVASFMAQMEGVAHALTSYHLRTEAYSGDLRARVQNGFNAKRSGDVLLVFDPGYISKINPMANVATEKGTTHGAGYAYDTQVPLLWFGNGIPKGNSIRQVSITDIASTLAMMLNVQLPSGNTGEPLRELFEGEGK